MECQAFWASRTDSVGKLTMPPTFDDLADVAQGRKSPLWMGLPERLRRSRKQAGLSPRQGSLFACVSKNLGNMPEGALHTPGIDIAEKIGAGLGLPVIWLAFGPEGDEPFQPKRRRPRSLKDDPEPHPGQG